MLDAAVVTGRGGQLFLERRLVDRGAADLVLEELLFGQRARALEVRLGGGFLGRRALQGGQALGRELAGDQRRIQDAALLRGLVLGPGQRGQGDDVVGQLGVVGPGPGQAGERQQRVDGVGVVLDERQNRDVAAGRRRGAAQVIEVADPCLDVAERRPDRRRIRGADVVRVPADLLDRLIGGVLLVQQRRIQSRGAGRPPVRDPPGGQVALVLHALGKPDDVAVEHGQLRGPLEGDRSARGIGDPQAAEHHRGDGGHDDEGEQPPAHPPVAEGQARTAPAGRGPGHLVGLGGPAAGARRTGGTGEPRSMWPHLRYRRPRCQRRCWRGLRRLRPVPRPHRAGLSPDAYALTSHLIPNRGFEDSLRASRTEAAQHRTPLFHTRLSPQSWRLPDDRGNSSVGVAKRVRTYNHLPAAAHGVFGSYLVRGCGRWAAVHRHALPAPRRFPQAGPADLER